MLRKTSAGAIAIALASCALFGGAALAGGKGDDDTFTGGPGGGGGDAKTVCFVVGDQTYKEKNTVAAAPGSLNCYSTGGAGGAGGAGANFD